MIYERPRSLQSQRLETERDAKTAGIMYATFRCKKCGGSKTTQGRKMLIKGAPKFGWVCGDCVEGVCHG